MRNGKKKRPPDNRRARRLRTGRALECQLGGDSNNDSTSIIRLQRLGRLHGLSGLRALLIGELAYGEATCG